MAGRLRTAVVSMALDVSTTRDPPVEDRIVGICTRAVQAEPAFPVGEACEIHLYGRPEDGAQRIIAVMNLSSVATRKDEPGSAALAAELGTLPEWNLGDLY